MNDFPVFAYYTVGVVMLALLLGVYGLVLAVRNGARKVAAILESRGTTEGPEEFDTQPRTSDRAEWDSLVADAALLTHEERDEEEDDAFAVDFVAWERECAVRPNIARYVAKLEERAR